MPVRRTTAGAPRESGFTLVEALVALVILAIGMLGIAALYIEGLRASRAALIRTEAVTLAADLADRIRINREGGAAYDEAKAADTPNANCLPGGAGCSPEEMAAHDVRVWLDAIAAALPGGTGIVQWSDPDTSDEIFLYDIEVRWTEAGQGALSYTLRVET